MLETVIGVSGSVYTVFRLSMVIISCFITNTDMNILILVISHWVAHTSIKSSSGTETFVLLVALGFLVSGGALMDGSCGAVF